MVSMNERERSLKRPTIFILLKIRSRRRGRSWLFVKLEYWSVTIRFSE